MAKRKFKVDIIDCEISKFIELTNSSNEASDYLLSQLAFLVGELPRAKQIEFLRGMWNAAREMRV